MYNSTLLSESVWVLWDNGFRNVYRCGAATGYDILPTDQPRQLLPGRLIDVGVQVERGSSVELNIFFIDISWISEAHKIYVYCYKTGNISE